MVVMSVMVVVCVVGVVGAVVSVLGYDKLYDEIGNGMHVPRHASRRARAPRPSRQLQALEAALTEEHDEAPPSCPSGRSHRGWIAR